MSGGGSGGLDARVRGGGGISPGPDNVDRQMAFLAAQNLVRCDMWTAWYGMVFHCVSVVTRIQVVVSFDEIG